MNSSSTSVAPFTGAIGWKVVLCWSSKRFFQAIFQSGSVLIFKKIFFWQRPEGLQVQWYLTLCALDRTCYWRGGEGIRIRIRLNTCTCPVSATTGQYLVHLKALATGIDEASERAPIEVVRWYNRPAEQKKKNLEIKQKEKYINVCFFCPPLLACSFLLSSSSLP